MKKYITILLIASLLLSACSINWNDEKNNTSGETQFEQKQKCEKYSNDANLYYKNSDGGLIIFYSKKLDTCVVAFVGKPEILPNYNPEDPVNPTTKKYIFDYLTKELILQTEDGIIWNNKIQELKGEKITDNTPLPDGYEGTTSSGNKYKVTYE